MQYSFTRKTAPRRLKQDPKDDMLLELAVEASRPLIVTHNVRDFKEVEEFGIKAITPQKLLRRLEATT